MLTLLVLASWARPPVFTPSPDLDEREQLILERLNAVRAEPQAFLEEWRWFLADELERIPAHRAGCDDGMEILEGLVGVAPRPPLAANQALTDAARAHARDMVEGDYFAHTNREGIGPNHRAIAAGYPLPVGAKLVVLDDTYLTFGGEKDANQVEALHTESMTTNDATDRYGVERWPTAVDSLIVDRCVPGLGHRNHLLGIGDLAALHREVGVGSHLEEQQIGGGTRRLRLDVAIESALRDDQDFFVLGAVFVDDDNNGRLDAGEALEGVDVRIGDRVTRTARGGGYTLSASKRGRVQVGGRSVAFVAKDANVKVDFPLSERPSSTSVESMGGDGQDPSRRAPSDPVSSQGSQPRPAADSGAAQDLGSGWRPDTAAVLGTFLLAAPLTLLLPVGFWSSRPFARDATVKVAGTERSLRHARPLSLCRQPGGRRRLFRSSRLAIHGDGTVDGRLGTASAVLRATGDGVVVSPTGPLFREDRRSRRWEPVSSSELARANVYRAGEAFFVVSD